MSGVIRGRLRRILLLFALLPLGCSVLHAKDAGRGGVLNDCLAEPLAASSFGGELWQQYEVFFTREEDSPQRDSERLEIVVELAKERLVMVGLSPFGNRGFQVIVDKDGVEKEVLPVMEYALDTEVLLRDFQLSFWPLAPLVKRLARCDISLEVDSDSSRRFIYQGQMLVEVLYQDTHELRLIRHDKGYRLRFRSI